jgi:ADP-ribose pyrophosphatase YjhB (NUDIX family)
MSEGRGAAKSDKSAPSAIDRAFQLAYVCAYRLMRVYWALGHPRTHGALVVLRNAGEVLLVRNSYVAYYSLPGGYVRRHETAREAALRELGEEVGVTANAESLVPVLDQTHDWEGKRDRVEIFALDVNTRPRVAVDHREVIEASWWSPQRALSLNLFPPLRRVLEELQAAP